MEKSTSRGVFDVASSLIADKAKAASEHARSVREAVREEVSATRQQLQREAAAARETLREYEPKVREVRESVSSVRETVREKAPETFRALGTMLNAGEGQSAESVCEYLALPFIHGAALQPEIKRLHAALDVCPEEAVLRSAHEQLRALKQALDAHGPLLLPAGDESAAAGAFRRAAEARRLLWCPRRGVDAKRSRPARAEAAGGPTRAWWRRRDWRRARQLGGRRRPNLARRRMGRAGLRGLRGGAGRD